MNNNNATYLSLVTLICTVCVVSIPLDDNATTAAYAQVSLEDSLALDRPVSGFTDVTFNDDGTKAFFTGHIGDIVHEYTLSDPYNMSSRELVNSLRLPSVNDSGSIHGIEFSPNGTLMYILNSGFDVVDRHMVTYELSTAFDTSSTITQRSTHDLVVSSAVSLAQELLFVGGFHLSNDGLNMYIGSVAAPDAIVHFTLSTAFDTSSYAFQSIFLINGGTGIDVDYTISDPQDVTLTLDGRKMFIQDGFVPAIYEFALDTPFDITSPTYMGSISVDDPFFTGDRYDVSGMEFHPDGTAVSVVSDESNIVNTFNITADFNLTKAVTLNEELALSSRVPGESPSDVYFNSDGTLMFTSDAESGAITKYVLDTAFDVDTAEADSLFQVPSSDLSRVDGVTFSTTRDEIAAGELMYVVGVSGADSTRGTVFAYNLTTPFDISGSPSIDSFARFAASSSTNPQGIVLSQGSIGGDLVLFVDSVKRTLYHTGLSTFFEFTDNTNYNPGNIATFTLPADDISPTGAAFNANGSKLFVVGVAGDGRETVTASVNEYDLAQAYRLPVDTANFKRTTSLSIGDTSQNPTGIAFNTDGTRMFITDDNTNTIREYELDTGFDLGTAITESTTELTVRTDANPRGVTFSNNGLYVYSVGTGNIIGQETLSSPFVLSSSGADRITFDATSNLVVGTDIASDIALSRDGTLMFILEENSNGIFKYDLSTPYNVSTATLDSSRNITASSLHTEPTNLEFSDDGTKMFVLYPDDTNPNTIDLLQFNLATAYDISGNTTHTPAQASSRNLAPQLGADGLTGIRGFTFSDDGAKMFVSVPTNNIATTGFLQSISIHQYTLGDSFDISDNVRYDGFSSVPHSYSTTSDIALSNNDGLRLFVYGGGDSETRVRQYDLSTAFNVVNTVEPIPNNFEPVAAGSAVTGVAFDDTGIHMYTVDNTADSITQYTLTTPFVLSTATVTNTLDIASHEDNPQSIYISDDGETLLVTGIQDDVNRYRLSTAFDLSTADRPQTISFSDERKGNPRGIDFSNGENNLFITNDITIGTERYANVSSIAVSGPSSIDRNTLTTSTDTIEVFDLENRPKGVAISPNGTKMFFVGQTYGGSVYEYNLSTPNDITTAIYVGSLSIGDQESRPEDIAFSQ